MGRPRNGGHACRPRQVFITYEPSVDQVSWQIAGGGASAAKGHHPRSESGYVALCSDLLTSKGFYRRLPLTDWLTVGKPRYRFCPEQPRLAQ